ncbi:MAG: Multidrug export protein MepA [Elusimicrobia bacterium ADurb.Bin231]|nr:MAG: Multidrug export protein MepA [Elusimicrobia bacterium ADurb.Bin231]
MPKLIESNVKSTLFKMAVPMLAGTIVMNTYNFVDTWFVSKLGTIPLAAMGFTFPVVMLFTFVASGIGIGITTLTSHAIGRADKKDASRIVTHGIILVILLSLLLSFFGYLSINTIFRFLGADESTLPLVKGYMKIWYMGAVFMAFPMMGKGILIAMGDSKFASLFMVAGALTNCILDPIMIFGLFGFPALGIWGAALATVIAQAVSSIWLLYLLSVKHHLLSFKRPEIPLFVKSVKRIMEFAIPGSISMMLMPISAAVITTLISKYGNVAVAAVSAAGRIEMFAFIIPMALGMSLVPFVSQNFGAGRLDRIKEAQIYSIRFAFFYGIFTAVLFSVAAPFFAGIFTKDKEVARIFILYVRTISFGYGMMEIHRYCGFFLTGIHKPVSATILNAVRVLVFLIPLSFLGSSYLGIRGIFSGRLISDIMSGILAIFFVTWTLKMKQPLMQKVFFKVEIPVK